MLPTPDKPEQQPQCKKEAEAKGFTVDDTCYPWFAYKGPRFKPTEGYRIPTDREVHAEQLATTVRDLLCCSLNEINRVAAQEALDAYEKEAK